MSELKVPSVQHLARNWRGEAESICRALVALARNPPRFNYNPLFGAIKDLLLLHIPYEQVVAGVGKIKREGVRDNLLGVLPLIRDHFSGLSPDFYQSVERRYYPIGRGLMIPFEPPMIYGIGGQLYFPWFSFWRANPLARERLSLFVTLVDEILLQDPDLENARFEILDFSAPTPKTARELTVLDARKIPRLSSSQKVQMLETFSEGFFQAMAHLAKRPPQPEGDPSGPSPDHNPRPPDLFD